MKTAILRRSLCIALLAALALPWVVTAAIAIHEAEHHADHAHADSSLLVLVHGHHHDHAVQEHEHPATPRARAESRLESLTVAISIADAVHLGSHGEIVQAEGGAQGFEPLSPCELCIWRL